ncbi:serine hydrolase [Streptomyces sp. NPDC052496]|uniref:serine hydrolase domain-containing protein n=1 Tax=Streptomyces sp. NPDC052496 TaxID=3154951 RepID=UPI003417B6E1
MDRLGARRPHPLRRTRYAVPVSPRRPSPARSSPYRRARPKPPDRTTLPATSATPTPCATPASPSAPSPLRHLLGHTSGLPDYVADLAPRDRRAFGANRDRFHTSEQQVALAMRHRPVFRPGARHAYSNTNDVLTGMIVRAATGHTWQHGVRARILRPLGLRHTTAPEGRPRFPHPHATEYQQFAPDGPYTDTTAPYRPYDTGPDGAMTSTAADLDRFFTALNSGRPPAPRPAGRDAPHRPRTGPARRGPRNPRRPRPLQHTALLRRTRTPPYGS